VLLCLALMVACRAGFIDMDTPLDRRTTESLVDGTVYHLVSVPIECDPFGMRRSDVDLSRSVFFFNLSTTASNR
jgi:hypothetical protein